MDVSDWSDKAVLDELARRLAECRLDKGITQAELARQAGVGRATVERLESGKSTQLTSLIRILRVLDLLNPLVSAVPKAGPGPVELLKLQSRKRKRATGKRRTVEVPGKPWTWDDDQ